MELTTSPHKEINKSSTLNYWITTAAHWFYTSWSPKIHTPLVQTDCIPDHSLFYIEFPLEWFVNKYMYQFNALVDISNPTLIKCHLLWLFIRPYQFYNLFIGFSLDESKRASKIFFLKKEHFSFPIFFKYYL